MSINIYAISIIDFYEKHLLSNKKTTFNFTSFQKCISFLWKYIKSNLLDDHILSQKDIKIIDSIISPRLKVKSCLLSEVIVYIIYDVISDQIEINNTVNRLLDSVYILLKSKRIKVEAIQRRQLEIHNIIEDVINGSDPRNRLLNLRENVNSNINSSNNYSNYIDNSIFTWKNQSLSNEGKSLLNKSLFNVSYKRSLNESKHYNLIELSDGYELYSTVAFENKQKRNKLYKEFIINSLPKVDISSQTNNEVLVEEENMDILMKNTIISRNDFTKEENDIDLNKFISEIKEKNDAFVYAETLSNHEIQLLMNNNKINRNSFDTNLNIPTYEGNDFKLDNMQIYENIIRKNSGKVVNSTVNNYNTGYLQQEVNNSNLFIPDNAIDMTLNDFKFNSSGNTYTKTNNINNNNSLAVLDIDSFLNNLASEPENSNINTNMSQIIYNINTNEQKQLDNQINNNKVDFRNKIRISITESVLIINNKGNIESSSKIRGQIGFELNNFNLTNFYLVYLKIFHKNWEDLSFFSINQKEYISELSNENIRSYNLNSNSENNSKYYKVNLKCINENIQLIDYTSNISLYNPLSNFKCNGKHNNENKYKLELQVFNSEVRNVVNKAEMIVKIFLKVGEIKILKSTHEDYHIEGNKVLIKVNDFNNNDKFLIGLLFETYIADYVENVKVSFRYLNSIPSATDISCGVIFESKVENKVDVIKKSFIEISFNL